MMLIGGALIIIGLLAGALFLNVVTALIMVGIGVALLIGVKIREEKESHSWRKAYPSYRY